MCGAKTHAIARESEEHEESRHWTLIRDYLISRCSWCSVVAETDACSYRFISLFFCTLIICKWDLMSGSRGCFCMWKWGFLFGVTLSTWDWWQGSIYVPGQLVGVLNKNLYQSGEKGWTSNSLGCADIWWLFIYLCTIWNAFCSSMGQLSIYSLLAVVFWAVPLYFCGDSPTIFASLL